MKRNQLLFGAAYYDEYLPYDRIKKDMEMMKKAGMNVIRIAESTWSTWEPQEGIFDFTHLHRMLTCSRKHGIQVIVGTPTYAIPTWLARKCPDIITETHAGPGRYGHRQNMDIAHPVYLKHAEIIIRKLMEEVSSYDHVIGFQLDNETKSYDTCSSYAQEKFIVHVRHLFQDDLDALNRAWGLDYWSNRINTWEDFPDVRGTINGSLGAEYQKFQRKLVTDFLAWQSAIVAEYLKPGQFITHNFDYDWRGYSFGVQPEVDQWEAARSLTIAGCDIYHPSAQDLSGKEISFGGAIARSLKKDNYLVLETEAQGNHGWLPYPGQLRLQAFSHLACGANAVLYWHWHSIHNAIESYWKGVLSHNLRENATYREACSIGEDFCKYGSRLVNLKKQCSVAILLDNESLTALQWFVISNKVTYNDVFRLFYDTFYEMNIECDILSVDDVNLFSQYKILVTPVLYSVSDSLVEHLKRYVADGGILLSTYKTAVSDRMLKIYHDDQPHGLTEVFGMTYDQFTDAVNVDLKDLNFPLTGTNSKPAVHHWMELLVPHTAQTLARYDHPHWNAYAAITGNRYGRGYAVYLGCHIDSGLLKDLLRFVCTKAGMILSREQYPVILKRGINDLGREIIYYFNYGEEEQTIIYHGADARILLQGHSGADHSTVPADTSSEMIHDGDRFLLSCWDFIVLETV